MNEFSQCGASEPFALRVIGDDMAPEFCDGHIVVVDPGGQIKSGCFVIARYDEQIVLRKLHAEAGRYYLSSLREEDKKEVTNLDSIVGVVSQRAGRRRREARRYD